MNEDKDENPRGEYNNNNRDKTHDMDKPLNLTGLHHRVERRPSITDKESGQKSLKPLKYMVLELIRSWTQIYNHAVTN